MTEFLQPPRFRGNNPAEYDRIRSAYATASCLSAFFCLARNLPTGEHAFPMFDRPLGAVDYILRY